MPRWLKHIIITTVLAVGAWAAKDRIAIEHRLSTMEEFVSTIDKRLGRIETKLDKALGDR